jgi:hypothetical protein
MAIAWDGTWNQSRRQTVQGALERITRMLTRSYLSVRAVNRDNTARNHYVTHFRNATLTELAHVTGVVRLMHDRIAVVGQTITMSYVPTLADFTALNVGPLPVGINFSQIEAFVVQNGVPAATPLMMYIGPSFFRGNIYIATPGNQRTGTGTILHELSHGVGDTDDHAYTWQPAYATITEAQRARNADSYRAYCQAFDQI